jgi:hypothetical protein
MKPPEDRRMAAEKAALDLQPKQPSWRATRALNGAWTKRLWSSSEHLPLWVTAGLIGIIFLIGWLLSVR